MKTMNRRIRDASNLIGMEPTSQSGYRIYFVLGQLQHYEGYYIPFVS